MAGPAPQTRNWSARENLHEPSGLMLMVHGLVEVPSTSKLPKLTESAERNPNHLGLALTIEDTGEPGTQVVCWAPATFSKEVQADEYNMVTVRWDVSAIAQVPVVNDSEYDKKVTVQMAKTNAMHAGKGLRIKAPKGTSAKPAAPKKAVAKKAAAKKAAPKKAKKKKAAKKAVAARVVRAVGGWAKGARKALTRAMGASTKKAPKKAGRKKAGRKKTARKAKGKKKR